MVLLLLLLNLFLLFLKCIHTFHIHTYIHLYIFRSYIFEKALSAHHHRLLWFRKAVDDGMRWTEMDEMWNKHTVADTKALVKYIGRKWIETVENEFMRKCKRIDAMLCCVAKIKSNNTFHTHIQFCELNRNTHTKICVEIIITASTTTNKRCTAIKLKWRNSRLDVYDDVERI